MRKDNAAGICPDLDIGDDLVRTSAYVYSNCLRNRTGMWIVGVVFTGSLFGWTFNIRLNDCRTIIQWLCEIFVCFFVPYFDQRLKFRRFFLCQIICFRAVYVCVIELPLVAIE